MCVCVCVCVFFLGFLLSNVACLPKFEVDIRLLACGDMLLLYSLALFNEPVHFSHA